jgi:hypothetical protein
MDDRPDDVGGAEALPFPDIDAPGVGDLFSDDEQPPDIAPETDPDRPEGPEQHDPVGGEPGPDEPDQPQIVIDDSGPRIELPPPDSRPDPPDAPAPADHQRPDDGLPDDPVVLDLDEPLEPADPSLPEAQDDAPDDGGPTLDDDVRDDPALAPDDLDAIVPLDVPSDNALLQPALITAALAVIGVAGGGVMGRIRNTTSSPDFVAALDQLGVDARVEHADLQDLHDRMAAGDRVLLATDGSAGVDPSAVVELAFIDETSGILEVTDRTGARRPIDLARFRTAWADSANEMVVASGAAGEQVALLPVVLDAPAAS